MNLTKKQIEEIAQELDCGMKVYVNPATLEIKAVPHLDKNFENEFLEKESQKIDEWDSFILPPPSYLRRQVSRLFDYYNIVSGSS